jgi:2-dehydro-3-deoxyphosphogalactonate aldolase
MTPGLDAPIVAILRGLRVDEAVDVGEALCAAGIRALEVPLNSPRACDSVRALAQRFLGRALVGAGTVLTPADVDAVADAGAELVVSPDADPNVIAATRRRGLIALPGVFTPTEAFRALRAGAHGLKLFPAEVAGPSGLRALRAVLPPATRVYAVGGVSPENVAEWRAAGADGIGVGSALYKPGMAPATIRRNAEAFVHAWQAATNRR